MRFVKQGLVAGVIAAALIGQLADAQRARPAAPAATPASADAQAALKDIETTLGFVPQFFRSVADAQLPSFWQQMKEFQVGETMLDNKTKELIGLAVAAQIPCEYCIYFHTEAARRHGASEQQIREAVGMAAMTRMASTVLNGSQIDAAQFRKDTQRLLKPNGKKQSTAATR
jgi:AhpD family alkylhydroperoxidase